MRATVSTAVIRKETPFAFKGVDQAKRQIRGLATRQELDRDSEIILVDGIEYHTEPSGELAVVACKDHDHTKILGTVLSLTRTMDRGVPALEVLIQVLPAGVSADADQTYLEIKAGARNYLSIGFLPLEWDMIPVVPGQTGRTFRKIELLEVSSVAIPSNRGARITEKQWDLAHTIATAIQQGMVRAWDHHHGAAHAHPDNLLELPLSREQLAVVIRETTKGILPYAMATTVAELTRRYIGRLSGRVD